VRIIRYQPDPKASPGYGWLEGERVGLLEGSPFAAFRRNEALLPINRVRLLAPTMPGKIICVGHNYAAHVAEREAEAPQWPLIFLKPPTAVIGPGDAILLPPQSDRVEHEAELAVVIRETCRWASPKEAKDHILGYTIANDITARDLQERDGQWTRSKGFDTFCPIGPWIETNLDPADILIKCTVNDQLKQMASTRDLIFSVPEIVAFVSSVMTLNPGDIILTGTPSGVGPLFPGDQVAVEIEGIGTLSNPVRKDPHRQ
jgi:2-keto-4-pentenoate hydratase/2-oxohepta-3-ene-1,7-dioic acid hydratase in catechol pathway